MDMSAAIDTIDHRLLLGMLHDRYSITGTGLRWFTSYLTNRTQSVIIHGVKSEAQPLELGVPRG